MIGILKLLKLSGYPVDKAKAFYKDHLVSHGESDGFGWDIVKYHFNENPFYKSFIGNIPDRWEAIPILRKEHLNGDWRDKVPPSLKKKKVYLSSTSGSTGVPLTYCRDLFYHSLVWVGIEQIYLKHHTYLDGIQARFYGTSRHWRKGFVEKMKDFFANRYRFDVLENSDKKFDEWIEVFKKHDFEYLYGYASVITAFAKHLNDKGLVLKQVCPSLHSCIITSEFCNIEDERLIKKTTGVSLLNEYGSSEFGVIAMKHNGHWEVNDALVYLEVVDDDGEIVPDGTEGRLLCTSLFSKGTPFIRYEIGDDVSISRTHGKTIIHSIKGRSNDVLQLKSGEIKPARSLYFPIKSILEKVPSLKEFNLEQISFSEVVLNYVSDKEIDSVLVKRINKEVGVLFGNAISITFLRVDKIERSKLGKHKMFISRIENA